MTREEAINWLDRLYIGADITDEYGDMVDMQPYEEAFNMAIKALEEEHCDDVVSRANLLKTFEDRFIELQKAHRADTQLGVNWCINTLKDMPPVTPTQRWIPVNERLPKNNTYVLTTIHVPGRQPHARSGWYQNGFFHNDNGDTWRAMDIEVKAWMPLPQPYAESEDRRSKDYRRATNGDMIKAMFPNAQIDYHEKSDLVDDYVTVFIKGCDTCQDYSYAWWNEPYKAESEE